MSVSLRWSGAAAAALLFLGGHLDAQNVPQVMTAPAMTSGQLAYNVGVLGNGVAPFNYNAGAAVPGINVAPGAGMANPYALSTVGGYNPYLANSASLSQLSNPYSVSTSPSGSSGYGGYYPPYSLDLGPTGSALYGYGYALQGMASLTTANAGYWKDIQTAALQREGVRQAAMDTARRRIEFEAWYDTVRPTALRTREREMATELETARRAATNTDILSGKALNTLLGSIQKSSGRLNSGQPVPIEETALKSINLTGGTSPAGVGMLKDGGKLAWPEGLRESVFDETRRHLQENLVLAVLGLKDGEAVPSARLKDIKTDFKTLTDKLEESANELSPSQYIEASRYLRQLGQSVKALSDSKVVRKE